MRARYNNAAKWIVTFVCFIFILAFINFKSANLQSSVLVLSADTTKETKNLLIFSSNCSKSKTEESSLAYLPQFKNPCIVDSYDVSIDDREYYSQHAFIGRIEKKYSETYADLLHRAAIQVTMIS